MQGDFYNGWWKDNLRMSKDTFDLLCAKLHPHIEKQVYKY